ncbi:MAG: anthranilate phosphoribosyltransferase, partial [Thermodesulfobacteriota bacterium]
IGIRTIFNILGPLTNPAGASRQVLGVYDGNLTEVIAGVLLNLGTEHAYVVWGRDGLDEITLTCNTKVTELRNGDIKTYDIKPEEFSLERCAPDSLKGGDADTNANIIRDIFRGKPGPQRDVVLLNAAAAIAAEGMAENIKDAVKIASESIDMGKALKKLNDLIEMTN